MAHFTEAERKKWADKAAAAAAAALAATRAQMLGALNEDFDGYRFDPGWWDDALGEHLEPVLAEISIESGDLFAERSGLSEILVSLGGMALAGVAVGVTMDNFSGYGQTVGDRVDTVLGRASDDGWDSAEFGATLGLDGDGGPLSENLADGMGVTASQMTSHGSAEEILTATAATGTKTWRCLFQNSRESHQIADGQTVNVDEMFTVGSGEGLFPGDPNLPDDELINCNCWVDYQIDPVAGSEALAASAEFGGPGSGPRNREGGVGRLERERAARHSDGFPATRPLSVPMREGDFQVNWSQELHTALYKSYKAVDNVLMEAVGREPIENPDDLAIALKIEANARVAESMAADPAYQALFGENSKDEAINDARDFIDQWAKSAADHDRFSWAMQTAAANVFGFDPPTIPVDNPRLPGLVAEIYEQVGPRMEAFVRASYAETQNQLKEAGIESLTVVRGFGTEEKPDSLKVGTDFSDVSLRQNPLSSWATEIGTAESFGTEHVYAMVLGSEIPAERIFSIPSTGPGCYSENEVVVIAGDPLNVTVAPNSNEALWEKDLGPNTDLSGVDLSHVYAPNLNLNESNLSDANLKYADLTGGTLVGTNLTNADVSSANLSLADLSGAYLSNANLSSANLSHANLSAADLTGADLTEADLIGADLVGADLTGAIATGANLHDAKLTDADLTGADLTGASFVQANLTGADLTGASFVQANLTGADLPGTNLTDANLMGAYFRGANLTGANLTGANLTNVDLTNVDLTNTDLTGTNLTGARLPADLKGVIGLPTDAIAASAQRFTSKRDDPNSVLKPSKLPFVEREPKPFYVDESPNDDWIKQNPDILISSFSLRTQQFGGPGSGPRNREGGIGRLEREREHKDRKAAVQQIVAGASRVQTLLTSLPILGKGSAAQAGGNYFVHTKDEWEKSQSLIVVKSESEYYQPTDSTNFWGGRPVPSPQLAEAEIAVRQVGAKMADEITSRLSEKGIEDPMVLFSRAAELERSVAPIEKAAKEMLHTAVDDVLIAQYGSLEEAKSSLLPTSGSRDDYMRDKAFDRMYRDYEGQIRSGRYDSELRGIKPESLAAYEGLRQEASSVRDDAAVLRAEALSNQTLWTQEALALVGEVRGVGGELTSATIMLGGELEPPIPELDAVMAVLPSDWVALANGTPLRVDRIYPTQRGYYRDAVEDPFGGPTTPAEIGAPEGSPPELYAHEFIHHMQELDPTFKALDFAFLDRRTATAATAKGDAYDRVSREVEPVWKMKYVSDTTEVCIPDKLPERYMGKLYQYDRVLPMRTGYETSTVGIQKFVGGNLPANMVEPIINPLPSRPEVPVITSQSARRLTPDTDTLHYILGVLVSAGIPPTSTGGNSGN